MCLRGGRYRKTCNRGSGLSTGRWCEDKRVFAAKALMFSSGYIDVFMLIPTAAQKYRVNSVYLLVLFVLQTTVVKLVTACVRVSNLFGGSEIWRDLFSTTTVLEV